ncbi:MAG: hypothetical protein LUE64_03535 [Candidatus Gastranaerophilales bacterium]|nr:hypothetical protein [Candidatus Gastranaerophilales bacterium]
MSENYTIGSYTIESKTYYDALVQSGVTDDATLKKLDTDGDMVLTEDELVSIEISDTDETDETETASTEEEEIEEKYEKQLLTLYEEIENLEDERRKYYNQAACASDLEEMQQYIESAESATSEIQSLRAQIVTLLSNKETEIANLDSNSEYTVSTSSDGVTATSISDVDFDFTENLTESQQSSVEAFKENWEANKSRYQSVAAQTGVPAELIAAIHWREASGSFNARLQDGGSLGSYSSWEESAIAALSGNYGTIDVNDITTWYDYAEHYNGMGYSNRGVTSPYVWAGTSNYTSGKYVADGVYDASYVDKQVGVAVLLKAIMT